KFKKFDIFSLFMFCQDISRNDDVKFNGANLRAIAEYLLEERTNSSGKSSSGAAIRAYYEQWREELPQRLGVRLDPKRIFDDRDRSIIFERDQGICKICNEAVESDEIDFDHFPVAHRDGGRTVPDNGRLVHRKCHP